jgi:hypothetical protein
MVGQVTGEYGGAYQVAPGTITETVVIARAAAARRTVSSLRERNVGSGLWWKEAVALPKQIEARTFHDLP